ncbi:YihY family inner membrane protein [Acidihalobacter ferrooxydans]|uniref:UPF0761 membrane protein BW247_13145 n=1 Tax=Acidihalobacter ferrooxydans TaxID=1765967 RepID=A0A1P8UJ92_9GAMM|nr:YihY family inner membrane protein [Acidihalobacter ferrooxydans]APZ43919.1 hypothetical protein BW247_13145 [Acidihalobacter ferrooxydans]
MRNSTDPGKSEGGRVAPFAFSAAGKNALIAFADLFRVVIKRFFEDRCMQAAGSLTFTSLLSLVPLVTVVFGVLSLFPVFQTMTGDLRHLLMGQLMPASGEHVEQYLLQFSEKASKLTIVGSLWLFVNVVLVLEEVDTALNGIWRAHRRRKMAMMLVVYWAMLTLAPLLLGSGIVASTYLYAVYKAHVYGGAAHVLDWLLLSLVPLFLETLAFSMLFALVPRVRVRLRAVLIGGLLTAVLFELAKRGFAFYVSNFNSYELIYGVFSAIPIFLIWLYLSWLMVLFGAEVTACLDGNCHRKRFTDAQAARSLWLAVRLIARLGEAQRRGVGLSLTALHLKEPAFDQTQVEHMLQRLATMNIAHQSVEGDWLVSRDLHELTLGELYRGGGFDLDLKGAHGVDSEVWDRWIGQRINEALIDASRRLDVSFDVLLAGQTHDDEPVHG